MHLRCRSYPFCSRFGCSPLRQLPGEQYELLYDCFRDTTATQRVAPPAGLARKSSMASTGAQYEEWLLTGGGLIRCPRCQAKSTRTGKQCGRPALKSSKTCKCQYHGGRSTGAKTPEGRKRTSEAHTLYGTETRALRASRTQASCRLAELEDALHLLGMTSAPRTRGRKPKGYLPLTAVEDVLPRLLQAGGN